MDIAEGKVFEHKKESSAKRVGEAIKGRYILPDEKKTLALARMLKATVSLQEKYNYLFLFYIEYENLFRVFLEEYVYNRFCEYGQKTYTQMDLDKFIEEFLEKYSQHLPKRLQNGIPESGMSKARNLLFKNLETFGWGTISNSKLTVKRPSITPEWFTFLLYFYFDDEVLTKQEIFSSKVFRKFLLNEYDIDYLLTASKMKKYVEISQLGDICNIRKIKEGILEYAESY